MSSSNILITGAASGIGNAVAQKQKMLPDSKLFLTGRNQEKLMLSLQLNETEQHKHIFLIGDLTNDMEVAELIKAIDEPLDGIVLSAGDLKYKPLKFLNRGDLNEMFDINFYSPVLLIQKLIKAKKIKNDASIVFVSSISARVGVAATLSYAASKAAVEAAVRVMAAELAPKKIKVNSVCPGLVDTAMLQRESEANGIDIVEANKANYPLGIGNPVDVASLISFLISKENNWITGQSIVIDGGYLLNK